MSQMTPIEALENIEETISDYPKSYKQYKKEYEMKAREKTRKFANIVYPTVIVYGKPRVGKQYKKEMKV